MVVSLDGLLVLFLFLFVVLLVVFLLGLDLGHHQLRHEPTIDDVPVPEPFEVDIPEGLFAVLYLLGPPQVQDKLHPPLLQGSDLPELVVVDYVIVLKTVYGTQVDVHPVPGYLLQLLGIDLVVQHFLLTLLNNLLTLQTTLLCNLELGPDINGKLVPREPLELVMFLVLPQEMFQVLAYTLELV